MNAKRIIEIFCAGCAPCDEAVALVERFACSSCEIEVLDMHDAPVAANAKRYVARAVSAVAIEGRLVACCIGCGSDEAALRSAGIGVPVP